jgi:hypothetical protein
MAFEKVLERSGLNVTGDTLDLYPPGAYLAVDPARTRQRVKGGFSMATGKRCRPHGFVALICGITVFFSTQLRTGGKDRHRAVRAAAGLL